MESPEIVYPAQPRKRRRSLVALLVILAGLITGLLIRKYFFFTAIVEMASMEPTLLPGDRLLVQRIPPNSRLNIGEIVVLEDPISKGETVVKRVIATGDSWVAVLRGRVYVNGQPLNEPYLQEMPLYTLFPIYVPPGKIFVLGDNRNNSMDSSDYGPVDRTLVKGVAVAIIWPPKRIRRFY